MIHVNLFLKLAPYNINQIIMKSVFLSAEMVLSSFKKN